MSWAIVNGIRLHYEVAGQGDPVLLVAGMSMPGSMWAPQVKALAPHFRVITFDHRGIGASVRATPRETIAEMADDAFAVLDAAGVNGANVYGISMGGLVAQEMALARPSRVRSLVLGCTGAPSDVTPRDGRIATLRYYIPPRVLFRLMKFHMYARGTAAALIDEDRDVFTRTPVNRAAFFAQGRAQASYRSRSRIATISAPTLVLHGDKDKIVPLKYGEELAAVIPGARLHVLSGAGHVYTTDTPEQANAAVQDFLAEKSGVVPAE